LRGGIPLDGRSESLDATGGTMTPSVTRAYPFRIVCSYAFSLRDIALAAASTAR
jgi:hypothetical protein